MALRILAALSAVFVFAASGALAQGYGSSPYSQYGQGYIPNQQPQYAPRTNPRYAPSPQHQAPPRYAPDRPAADGADPAAKVSKQLNGLREFLAGMQGQSVNQERALNYIETQIAPDVDFKTMTDLSLGRLANRMSPQQRARAEAQLRRTFTTKLIEVMGDFRSTRFSVGKTRRGTSKGELVVPVRLDRWQGEPLKVNFRFYKARGGWKVFDAEAGGQSAVMFFRGYFARQWRGS